MAPEEAQQSAPRRRGRPPGSKTRTRKRGAGGDLVTQLNSMVAELITKNRQLRREVKKLTDRARKSDASKGVERGIRTISRRVQRALGSTATRRRRKAAPANGRRRKSTTTTRRRRKS